MSMEEGGVGIRERLRDGTRLEAAKGRILRSVPGGGIFMYVCWMTRRRWQV